MGCQESKVRQEPRMHPGAKSADDAPNDDENLPWAPANSWYCQPLEELSEFPVTDFHVSHFAQVVFARTCIPTAVDELALLPNHEPVLSTDVFDPGADNIFGMAYLYNTALFTEHRWRGRIAADANQSQQRFQRPFYSTQLCVRLTINGIVVPDVMAHEDSVPTCTSTLSFSEAVAQWKAVPLPLLPPSSHFTLQAIGQYRGLVAAFAAACLKIDDGVVATVQVELCYGCREEGYCSGPLAEGTFHIRGSAASHTRLNNLVNHCFQLRAEAEAHPLKHVAASQNQQPDRCAGCGIPQRYKCTTCGAAVCGSRACMWRPVQGYPCGCKSHHAVEL